MIHFLISLAGGVMNFKITMMVFGLTVISGTALALDCGEVTVNTLGPAKGNAYSTNVEFKCFENDFNSTSGGVFDSIKNKLFSNLDVVGNPVAYEDETKATFEFTGKNKNSTKCVINEDAEPVLFKVRLSLDKNSNKIEIAKSSLGKASTSSGDLKNLYLLSEIYTKDGSYFRSEKIESLVEIKGVARNFPAAVKNNLNKTFKNFSSCLRAEIAKN
jgi:hypothetical protein